MKENLRYERGQESWRQRGQPRVTRKWCQHGGQGVPGRVWSAEERQVLGEIRRKRGRERERKTKPGRDTMASEAEVQPGNLVRAVDIHIHNHSLIHSFSHPYEFCWTSDRREPETIEL